MIKYEAIEKRKPSSELADYEIRVVGATKAAPKIATVWGHYGTDAKARAEQIVRMLNQEEA